MKAALVITEDVRQIVLTPENEIETKILSVMKGTEKQQMDLFVGSFYDATNYQYAPYKSSVLQECEGGWIREYSSKDSLIIVVKDAAKVDSALEDFNS